MRGVWIGVAAAFGAALGSAGAEAGDLADAFGALPEVLGEPAISPAGTQIAYIAPARGGLTALMVAPLDGSAAPRPAVTAGQNGFKLRTCRWASEEDLWCRLTNEGDLGFYSKTSSYSRLLAVKRDGSGLRPLGVRENERSLGFTTSDGVVIHTFKEQPGMILVDRYRPEETNIDSRANSSKGGEVVEKVNIATGRRTNVEGPNLRAAWYLADNQGAVRMMAVGTNSQDMRDTGARVYMVRPKGGGAWSEIGRDTLGRDFQPNGFDETGNWLYVTARKDGRMALFRYATDGSGKRELVKAHPRFDIDGLVTVGPDNRAVGVGWEEEAYQIEYFDADFQKLDRQLAAALKGSAIVSIVDESANRERLLVFAGSDRDPGRYFLYDKPSRRLAEVFPVRGALANLPMGEMRSISYPARDGTQIPAYLTFPPGKTDAKNLPAIVMPHGGPSARDSWGFDYLTQYFASKGYIVIQPQYRGSEGYGKNWNESNAFANWERAISDVNDAGGWLLKQGLADPKRLAIVGWSYGGYAALQANVVNPDLFKAAVAIAPVADLVKLRQQWADPRFSSSNIAKEFFGQSVDTLANGSPVRAASRIKAPVILFHGDKDTNVDVDQSKDMDRALKAAGKRSELVLYPGRNHYLEDPESRSDMLRRSADFLAAALGTGGAAGAGQ